MRFVRSRGKLGLWCGGSGLDRRGNLWCSIEPGELVLPWSLRVHVHWSWTTPKTRSIGLARGQDVGHQSNAKRGWLANHCSTVLALCIQSLSTTTEMHVAAGAG